MEKVDSEKRTKKQNNSLHKWCEEFATELNNRGLYYKQVTKEDFDVEWDKDMVKKVFWQAIGKTKVGKEHTSDWTKAEMKKVQNVIEQILHDPDTKLGQAGINIPFPSQESESLLAEHDNMHPWRK